MLKFIARYSITMLLCLISFITTGQEHQFEPIPVEREDGFYATVNYDSNMLDEEIELELLPGLTLEHIKTVKKIVGSYSNRPEIAIKLTKQGALIFQELTKGNIGKPIAIVLDKSIVYLPFVQSEIAGGRLVISGNFSLEETDKMMRRLKGK